MVIDMKNDISEIMNSWEYQPNMLIVRKIIGDDGKEKLQVRVHLGILQMELEGRPDGKTPRNSKSLLDYYRSIIDELKELKGTARDFVLTDKDMKELDSEIMQYYHRRICLFALKDYAHAKMDAEHNLYLMDIIKEHCKERDFVEAYERFRPYVLMERARAAGLDSISRNDYANAMKYVSEAIEMIEGFYFERGLNEEELKQIHELLILKKWRSQIHQNWEGGIVESDDNPE